MKRIYLLGAMLAIAVGASLAAPSVSAATQVDSVRAAPAVVPVRTIEAATPQLVTVRADGTVAERRNAATAINARLNRMAPLLLLPFVFGVVRTAVSADKDSYPARDTVRQQHNQLLADLYYCHRNRSGTVAPACARGTTATKVKTTNNTTFIAAGQPIAKNATDDFWTLTGGNLAVGSFRKYRLLIDTAGAATVQASTDAATAALCDFATVPADGIAIIGVLTVQNGSGAVFIPGTTNLNAAGITSTFIDGSDGLEILATPITP